MRTGAFILLLASAAPAYAQDHAAHQPHEVQAAAPDKAPPQSAHPEQESEIQAATALPPMDHGSMDHQQPGEPGGMDSGAVGHDPAGAMEMDDGAIDHSAHGAMDKVAVIPEAPPPPEAYSGPAYAADAFVGPRIMAASRAAVARVVSGLPVFWFMADRAEYRVRQGKDGYLWDVQGYYGGDIDKFWFKSEGEGVFSENPESAEVQALWSPAIGPWWDMQAGIRQDLAGPDRTHAVVGVQGLAPYLFEVDAAAFVSNKGDVTARIEGELDQRITQRLILQPRAEIGLSAQDIPELGIGAGVDRIEAGLRLRYEFVREFAPYVGIDQEWRLGQSADYARAAGEDPSVTSFVVGVRLWF